ncbi:uncharacterized protein [Primulina huaijiensis]|uniref:uncharacterized protein n=1 Tax=Primulina huaijiensis TaxID=1492673 RepID=UPI003CC6FAB5
MPPRRVFRRDSKDRLGGGDMLEEEIPPPPPNQDGSARVLTGMARILGHYVENVSRVRPEAVCERFRRMDPYDFSCTTDPFMAEGWIRSLEAPASGRAYVMHAEEAEPETTLITGRIRLEAVATNVLLDSGAAHSFISESFVNRLRVTLEQLHLGFIVIVPSREEMLLSNVVRGVDFSMQGYSIRADLIVLPMPEFDIILGMNWFAANGASIDFRRRTVSINPDDGESFLFEAA